MLLKDMVFAVGSPIPRYYQLKWEGCEFYVLG